MLAYIQPVTLGIRFDKVGPNTRAEQSRARYHKSDSEDAAR
jgi:hypothetical protein